MKLTFEELVEDLERTYEQMKSDDLRIGLVAHIGDATEPIGNYFANAFNCDIIHLPSIKRKGKNQTLTNLVNNISPHLPEFILRIISYQYKRIYRSSEKLFPGDDDLDELSKYEKDSPILLVDDNSFTGKTLELWKQKIKGITGKLVWTYSITVTGSYEPDYYSIKGWRSFEWRPIGI